MNFFTPLKVLFPAFLFAAVGLLTFSCASVPPAAKPAAIPPPSPGVNSVPLASRPGAAVFSFEVKSQDPAYAGLGSDVAQALTEALIKGTALRPVEREKLEAILMEQEFSTSGLVKESDAIKAGRLAGARYILLGSVSIIGGQVRLNARLLDVETAEITAADSATGSLASIFEVEDALAKKMESPFLNP